MAALTKLTQRWLAIVQVFDDDSTELPCKLQGPVTQATDWAEVSKNLELNELLQRASEPVPDILMHMGFYFSDKICGKCANIDWKIAETPHAH